MSKRTIGLIISLFAITAILVYIAVSPKNTSKETSTQPVNKASVILPETRLMILQNPLTTSSPSGSLNVNIDTGKNNVTAVQLELSFDPTILTKIAFKPGGFFENPTILINDIDYKNGKISYALGISPTGVAKTGKGVVATIEFTADAKNIASTKINFMPKTLVTAKETTNSVLKEAVGINISFFQTQKINTASPSTKLIQ